MKPSAHTKPNTRRKKKGATHRATQRAENGRIFCENAWGTLRTGDIVQAKKYAKMALSLGADEGRGYSILAAIALAENDSSAVLACSDRGLAKTAYESYRLYLHAARCQANELWEEALENAKNAFNLDTTNDLALLAIADAQRNLNNRLPAFVIYQNLRNRGWNLPGLTDTTLTCLEGVSNWPARATVELFQGAQEYLSRPDLNPQAISPLVSWLLAHRYLDAESDPEGLLHAASRDEFFVDALNQLIIATNALPPVIRTLRRSLLSRVLEISRIPEEQVGIACALAQQSYQTEYVDYIDADEMETLESLASVLDNAALEGNTPLEELAPLFLLYAMFLPLQNLKCFASLGERPLNDWPLEMRPLIQRTVLDALEERALAMDMPGLTAIEDEISQKVQDQYEENPYPRWTHIPAPTRPFSYAERIFGFFPNDTQDKRIADIPRSLLGSQRAEVLVAGCGTGLHPLEVAIDCPNISVVAADLSRASLAYGKRMAQNHGVTNVEFLHADILELQKLGKMFPAIECAGVLHHMSDPEAGLRVLRKILMPQGLIFLGLYSERARESVVAIRNYLAAMKLDASEENIRQLRHEIVMGKKFTNFPEITTIGDIFSMSGMRDLLFHVQEHRFTPLEIKTLCNDNNLNFLGFIDLAPPVIAAYEKLFPDDPEMTSLSNWDIFEQKNPSTFRGMFKFVCQAI